jgi:hypothetical protein
MTLQTTHNTATTSLQRELDTLRQQQQTYKVQMRELEMGNDDLERNERAVMSSLADTESKYSRVLEEKILLEHELLDKANLEEETQRLKDEVRGEDTLLPHFMNCPLPVRIDAEEEISNLKRLLEQARATSAASSIPSSPNTEPGDLQPPLAISSRHSLDDDLLRLSPQPPDLLLSDLTPVPRKTKTSSRSMPPPAFGAREIGKSRSAMGQSALLSRAGFPTTPTPALSHSIRSPSSLPRSSTLPTLSPARTTAHTVRGQSFTQSTPRPAPSNLFASQESAPKSKGVQMISALRSRVQTTQQRLIPGIPRLRMASISSRNATPPMNAAASTSRRGSVSTDGRGSRAGRLSTDERGARGSMESQRETERSTGAQSPGWVLIQTQDDSPFRPNNQDSVKEQRRASNPMSPISNGNSSIPSAFKPLPSTSRISTGGIPRRPQSRLSLTNPEGSPNGGLSPSSSIPISLGRPATPTFLPVPTYHSQGGGTKRSSQPARRGS